jgi:hypothetical protein
MECGLLPSSCPLRRSADRITQKSATVRVELLTYGAAQESFASSKDGGDDDHRYTGAGSWTIIADIERPRRSQP